MESQALLLKTLSRGNLAEMKEIVENCQDKELGRSIYRELLRLASVLSEKHGFAFHKKGKVLDGFGRLKNDCGV